MPINIVYRESKTAPFFTPSDEFRLWFQSTYVATGKVTVNRRKSKDRRYRSVEFIWNDLAAEEEYNSNPKTKAMRAQRKKWNTENNHLRTTVSENSYDKTVFSD